MAKPPKQQAPQTKFSRRGLIKRAMTKEITELEGDADRSQGRKTRAQQRGRLRG